MTGEHTTRAPSKRDATVTLHVVADLSDKLTGLLEDIANRLPAAPGRAAGLGDTVIPAQYALTDLVPARILDVPTRKDVPARPSEPPVARSMAEAVAMGHRQALNALLGILDDWIAGARENHAATEHRYENVGEECWTRVHPADVRTMVNDACREMGIPIFSPPTAPPEE